MVGSIQRGRGEPTSFSADPAAAIVSNRAHSLRRNRGIGRVCNETRVEKSSRKKKSRRGARSPRNGGRERNRTRQPGHPLGGGRPRDRDCKPIAHPTDLRSVGTIWSRPSRSFAVANDGGVESLYRNSAGPLEPLRAADRHDGSAGARAGHWFVDATGRQP